jgi:PTH1 family peptidyl-tRNA hydrolase|tara:strand:+ start:15 stop:611 length:597 start_codon:yes stop_codon:yes gene_type:complete
MNTLLLVGLGNPGKEYLNTRHNAGSDFVRMLCNDYQVSLAKEKLVNGYYAKFIINDCSIILCIPDTFMNESGISVSKAKKFFKVENHEILIIHDELDLHNGCIRLKDSGGHGGHNGLRNIIDHLNGDSSFKRMRIGIGHPGKDKDIVSYVLNKPSESERKNMENKMKSALPLIESLVINGWEKTIMKLHSSEEKKDES